MKGFTMKDKLTAVADHLSTHKTKYGVVVAIGIAGGYTLNKITKEWIEFYDEHVAPQMETIQ
jgi:hypothetical protein